jgi:hypothetical protein
MLMPVALSIAAPLRLTVPLVVVVTVELFAAILPPDAVGSLLAPAVTLSIWLALSGCFVVLGLLWP